MHEVLVNRLGGLSLPRKSVVRLTDRPDMTLDVYPGRKTTMQQQQQQLIVMKVAKWSFFNCEIVKYNFTAGAYSRLMLVNASDRMDYLICIPTLC